MGKHYSKEMKLEADELFQAGKTHSEITAALGIRDAQHTKKWIRAYRKKEQKPSRRQPGRKREADHLGRRIPKGECPLTTRMHAKVGFTK